MIRIGCDIEARVLARAVRWTAERRVFLNGGRTVRFGRLNGAFPKPFVVRSG